MFEVSVWTLPLQSEVACYEKHVPVYAGRLPNITKKYALIGFDRLSQCPILLQRVRGYPLEAVTDTHYDQASIVGVGCLD